MRDALTAKEREKTRKALARIFEPANRPINPAKLESALGENGCIVNPGSQIRLVPRTEDARRIASEFVSREDDYNLAKKPELELDGGVSQFNIDFLYDLIRVFKAHTTDTVNVRTGDKLPMVLESDHFTVALAPRIPNGEYENLAEWL